MDGNGRWARKRGLPRVAGHRAGTENIRQVLEAAVELGIGTLTIYAFSTENWRRPEDEVQGLMKLFNEFMRRELDALNEAGVRLRHIGRRETVPSDMLESIEQCVARTAGNTRITLNVAFNYGGRAEIVDAAARVIRAGVDPNALTEDVFAAHLYTSGIPDPDLIIRTGGDMRLSNFLLWQAAYAEFYSTETFWPDFDREALRKALVEYQRRERRYGGVIETAER
jgi:undecaprenyl diphosphate synthase